MKGLSLSGRKRLSRVLAVLLAFAMTMTSTGISYASSAMESWVRIPAATPGEAEKETETVTQGEEESGEEVAKQDESADVQETGGQDETEVKTASDSNAVPGTEEGSGKESGDGSGSGELPEQPEEKTATPSDAGKPLELTAEAGGFTVRLAAEEGVLPEDATMTAESIDIFAEGNEAMSEALWEAVQEDGYRNFANVYAADIKIYDAEGNRIQPDGEVTVTYEGVEWRGISAAGVYHIADDNTVEKITDLDPEEADATFAASHFSVYAVATTAGIAAMAAYTDYHLRGKDGTDYGYFHIEKGVTNGSKVNVYIRHLDGREELCATADISNYASLVSSIKTYNCAGTFFYIVDIKIPGTGYANAYDKNSDNTQWSTGMWLPGGSNVNVYLREKCHCGRDTCTCKGDGCDCKTNCGCIDCVETKEILLRETNLSSGILGSAFQNTDYIAGGTISWTDVNGDTWSVSFGDITGLTGNSIEVPTDTWLSLNVNLKGDFTSWDGKSQPNHPYKLLCGYYHTANCVIEFSEYDEWNLETSGIGPVTYQKQPLIFRVSGGSSGAKTNSMGALFGVTYYVINVVYHRNGGTTAKTTDEYREEPDGEHSWNKKIALKGSGAKTAAHANQNGHKVLFLGWTETDTDEHVYVAGESVPEALESINLNPFVDRELYPIWALDSNDNGKADCEETLLKVTYDLNSGTGSITDNTAYVSGNQVTVTNGVPTPPANKEFTGWLNSADNKVYQAGQTFTITKNTTLKAQYEDKKWTITVNVTGGKANPSGPIHIVHGNDQTIAFSPDAGYALDTVKVDGAAAKLDDGTSYTFTNVQKDHTIEVVYSADQKGPNGSPDGVPDQYQKTVVYKVVNGQWNEGGTADKAEVITVKELYDSGQWGSISVSRPGPSVGEKPNAGYKAGSWSPELKTSFDVSSPETQTFTYTYVKDTGKTTDIHYTVKYVTELEGVSTQHLNDTGSGAVSVWAGSSSAEIDPAIAEDKYPGYKLEKTEPELPISVSLTEGVPDKDNIEITATYVKDDTQTVATSYTVEYYKDGAKVAADSYTRIGTDWKGNTEHKIAIQNEIDKDDNKYPGYSLENTEPSPLPASDEEVADGTVIKLNYVKDENKKEEYSFPVEYYQEQEDGTYPAEATREGTVKKSVWAGTPVGDRSFTILESDVEQAPFADYALDSDKSDALPKDVKPADIETPIKLYYSKDVNGDDTDNDGRPNPDGVPDKYQYTVTYTAGDGGKIVDDTKNTQVKTMPKGGNGKYQTETTGTATATVDADEGFTFDYWDLGGDTLDSGVALNYSFSAKAGETYNFTAHFAADEDGDETPDKYQVSVTFKVKNGSWDTGASEDIVKTYKLAEKSVKGGWEERTDVSADAPAAGSEPAAGYKAGGWDQEVPAYVTNAMDGQTYTYEYAKDTFTVTVKYVADDETVLGKSDYTQQFEYDAAYDVSSAIPEKITVGGVDYVKESVSGNVTGTMPPQNVEIIVTYSADKGGGQDGNPDGIPDKYQVTVTFKVENGEWNNGGSGEVKKNYTIAVQDEDAGTWTAKNDVPTEAPVAGDKPATGYTAGDWDKEVPAYVTKGMDGQTYTYEYAKDKFKVTVKYVADEKIDLEKAAYTEDVEYEAEYDVSTEIPDSIEAGGVTYVKESVSGTVEGKMPAENVEITVTYSADKGGPNGSPDGTPDKYQVSVTFKVKNGEWNTGGSNEVKKYYTIAEKDEATGTWTKKTDLATDAPEAGDKPATGYKAGYWNKDVPGNVDKTMDGAEYTYSYIRDDGQTVVVSYTVEYYKDGEKAENYTISGTDWSGNAVHHITITETIDQDDDKYAGYKLNSTDPDPVPAKDDSVVTGTTIKLYYVKDESKKEKYSFTVEYYKEQEDGTYPSTADQTGTVEKFEWAGKPAAECEFTIETSDVKEAPFPGYALDNSHSAVLPRTVTPADSSTPIKLYYSKDEKGGEDADGDGKPDGDGIPDKYQVTVMYQAEPTEGGRVSKTEEILTIEGEEEEGEVTVSAEAEAEKNYAFDRWTADSGLTVANPDESKLEQSFTVKGGESYTFTANFGKDEKGGEDVDGDGKPDGDDIPDKYQVTVMYQAEPAEGGRVSKTEETLTIEGEEEEGEVTVSVEAEAEKNYAFDRWTADSGLTVANPDESKLEQSFTVKGGESYTFTANFGKDEKGGEDADNDGKPDGDGIPDKYQVTVIYQAEPAEGGRVSKTEETLTIEGEEEEGEVTVSVEAEAEKNYAFDRWTADNGLTVANPDESKLEQSFTVKGGESYTFTANFGKDEKGGEDADNDGKPDGDGIPDKYQVTVIYQAEPAEGGRVSKTEETLTIEGEAEEGEVTVSAEAEAEKNYAFDRWTADNGLAVADPDESKLEQSFTVKGGESYTFTANFGKDEKGGEDADGDGKPDGDGIPDNYQVEIIFVAGENGTVTPERQIVTFDDNAANRIALGRSSSMGRATSGSVTARAQAIAAAGYAFDRWTRDGEPIESGAALEQTFVAEGGNTYTFEASFGEDRIGGSDENGDGEPDGDGIPDRCQVSVTYQVSHGTWADGTRDSITEVVTLRDADGNISAEGSARLEKVPGVPGTADSGYSDGGWDTVPENVTKADDNKIYSYSYSETASQPSGGSTGGSSGGSTGGSSGGSTGGSSGGSSGSGNGSATTEIPDNEVPLAEIPDNPVPLAAEPLEMIAIEDDDVPLAFMAPMTGDNRPVGAVALFGLLALGMMGAFGILGFKKKDEEEA